MKIQKTSIARALFSFFGWGKCPPASQSRALRLPPQRGSNAAPQRPALLSAIRKNSFLVIVFLLSLFVFSPNLMAEEVNNTAKSEGESVILPKPMDFAKSTYKKLLKLNEEPPSEARNAAIIKLSDELFDYKKIAANTLGEKWDALEESQQNELHSLFKQLLELNYIDRISQKNFKQNYKIDWDKATKNKNTAIVTCFIQQKDVETELDFHLYASDKLWKLNNIHIDGVSLTNTYWKKYGKHYDEKGYDGLVKEMKAQIEKLEKAKTKK